MNGWEKKDDNSKIWADRIGTYRMVPANTASSSTSCTCKGFCGKNKWFNAECVWNNILIKLVSNSLEYYKVIKFSDLPFETFCTS